MANITLSRDCLWSTCSLGNLLGNPPESSDNIYLNGFSLTLDTTADETYTCALIKACASNGTTFTAGTILMGAAASQILNANITSGTVNLLTLLNGKTITIVGTATGGIGVGAGGTNAITVQSGGTLASITNVIGGDLAAPGASFGVEVLSGGSVGTIGTTTGGNIANNNYGLVLRPGGTVNSIGTSSSSSLTQSVGVHCGGTIGTITNAIAIAANSSGVYVYSPGLIGMVANATGGSGNPSHGVRVSGGTVSAVTQAYGGSVTGANGVTCAGGTVTVTSAKGSMTAGAYGAYGVSYQSGICTVNGTDLTGVGGAVGLGSSTSKLKMGPNTAIGLWDSATGLSQILLLESTGVAASSDVLSGTPKWTGATTPNIGTMPIYMLKTGKI